jgi:hypothetical protein
MTLTAVSMLGLTYFKNTNCVLIQFCIIIRGFIRSSLSTVGSFFTAANSRRRWCNYTPTHPSYASLACSGGTKQFDYWLTKANWTVTRGVNTSYVEPCTQFVFSQILSKARNRYPENLFYYCQQICVGFPDDRFAYFLFKIPTHSFFQISVLNIQSNVIVFLTNVTILDTEHEKVKLSLCLSN